MLKNYSIPIIMWLVFESIAVILWQALDNIFYLFNFSYIGTSIAIGLFLFARKQQYARHVIQFAVGLYMLGISAFFSMKTCRLKVFGIICSWVFLKPPPSTMPWPKSLAHLSSDEAGAAMPAGQL